MYLSCGDSAATDSIPSFAKRLGLYAFGKKSEQGRRMDGEKNLKRIRVDHYGLILYKPASLSFSQLPTALFLKHRTKFRFQPH